jgi:hypothetical protein
MATDTPLPADLAAAVDRLGELLDWVERHPHPEVRERAIELLQTVDKVHRAGLTRLVAALGQAGGPSRDAALADAAVRLLLEMYDLLPADVRPAQRSTTGFVPLSSVRVVRSPRTAAR